MAATELQAIVRFRFHDEGDERRGPWTRPSASFTSNAVTEGRTSSGCA